ncbi:Protein of unknown function [Gordonia malaquae]|uniref:DUF2637 domain-containing protein n=1 Tax=Gordonia malaquae NBRC 108250 TaxID=1223542 RepID=M3UYE1_GORML|nr:DUF2637 domain-containing protein [Gordonia malaquae]GAC80852.1 hypothetical protein GM1_023_00110 [Gordonia malaquae NBRC 108250]SEB66834.1 Protein of unknown function [Gordonia malaquae]
MLNKFRSDPGIETYGRGYAWALVLFFTAASVLLNGAHAVLGMAGESPWAKFWAVVTAVLFPLAVLAETHFLVNLIREWDMRARWIAALRIVCILAVLVVAYIAFVRSFYALGDMAALMGIPDEDWWMLPASIDAMIILSTLGVVIAEGQMALDRDEGAVDQPLGGPVPLVVTDELTAPEPQLAAPVTSRTDGPSVSSALELTDATDELTTIEAVSDDDELTVSGPVTRSGRTDEAQVTTVPSLVTDELTTLEQVVSDDVVSAETAVSDDVPLISTDEAAPASSSVTTADERTDGAATDDGLIVLAEQVRSRKGLRAPAPKVAAALEQAAAGQSPTAIAKEIGGSHNTIRGWIEEARDLDPGYAARLDGKPQLVAVGSD